jgi:hypothetical protein
MALTDMADAARQERDLYRLLYSSRARPLPPPSVAAIDILDILRTSRRSNPAYGITGVLLTNGRLYSQLLEGPEAAIKNLFGHISCDGRHRDIKIISHHPSERRFFREWSMAHVEETAGGDVIGALFPQSDGQSDIIGISQFCTVVRRHLLATAQT